MPSDLTVDLLSGVTAETLEETAFIFSEPTDEGWDGVGKVIEASLDFTEPDQGRIVLAAAPEFGEAVAATLLDVEPGDEEAAAQASGAIGELVNILAGALLEALYGSEKRIKIGLPEVSEVSTETHTATADGSTCSLALMGDEEYRIDVSVYLGS